MMQCNASQARGYVLQVHGFRLNAWDEHTGQVKELYEKPESLECMRDLNAIGDKNWDTFVGEEIQDMSSHLMSYPIKVSRSPFSKLSQCSACLPPSVHKFWGSSRNPLGYSQ